MPPGDHYTPAFTDFGIENLRQLVEIGAACSSGGS
jgi:hypothetical protein